MANQVITAVIIDDHPVSRAGVHLWCEQADPPISLLAADKWVGAAWTGAGATADVVILDLGLEQNRQSFEELRRLVQSGRNVVVYTQDESDATAMRCIQLGALAYVTKTEGPEHLVAAIRSVAGGKEYTPPSLSGAIAADDDPNRPKLTPRETQALLAWFGAPSKQLAAKSLNITMRTLDTYISRARIRYANVGRPAPSKTMLVKRALEDGLIDLDDLQGPDQHQE